MDTSSRYLTVAAKNGEDIAVNHLDDCAMRHSVILMDEIDKCLEKVGLAPRDCDYFVAVTGPGSFTGIRIGVSCIKGFATALDKKAYGVTSFKALSYNVARGIPFLIAIDAAHGYFYVCGFNSFGEEDISPRYITDKEAENFNRPIYGFEDLPLKNYTKLDVKGGLLKAAINAEGEGGKLEALYIRKSQAEEERLSRLNAK